MIPSHVIQKIRRIHIKSRRTVDSFMAGRYRSVFRGSGIEFEEVREYSPGDDVHAIDWKVSARLGKPYVKRYREERESTVLLLIDMSASLGFGTFSGAKIEKAAEAASVLAFNAIRNNDKVGAIFFTDHVEQYIPPKKGSSHVWRVIQEIFTFVPQGRKTRISSALDFLARIAKKKSFVFILSDFLDDGYYRSLLTLKKRHETIGILIIDKGSFSLPGKGIVSLLDFETLGEKVMDASSRRSRDAFAAFRQKDRQRTLDVFSRAGSDVVELETGESVSDVLTRYFRLREKRFR